MKRGYVYLEQGLPSPTIPDLKSKQIKHLDKVAIIPTPVDENADFVGLDSPYAIRVPHAHMPYGRLADCPNLAGVRERTVEAAHRVLLHLSRGESVALGWGLVDRNALFGPWTHMSEIEIQVQATVFGLYGYFGGGPLDTAVLAHHLKLDVRNSDRRAEYRQLEERYGLDPSMRFKLAS